MATDAVNFRVFANPLNRFSLSSRSALKYAKDGSLTLYFGPQKPKDAPEENWLPTTPGQTFRLALRYYGAKGDIASGKAFPPPVIKQS
ncbi:hypothetical protein D3C79_821630 [compost metagenome]